MYPSLSETLWLRLSILILAFVESHQACLVSCTESFLEKDKEVQDSGLALEEASLNEACLGFLRGLAVHRL